METEFSGIDLERIRSYSERDVKVLEHPTPLAITNYLGVNHG